MNKGQRAFIERDFFLGIKLIAKVSFVVDAT